ncbi:MAG: hypothetical protein RSG52_15750 [Terrisporobacter sp.]|uniref:hypothetical protein n=1 Tax=Terrisporobacter sp. TaxID=1965305 RepID=UPI002FCC6AF0
MKKLPAVIIFTAIIASCFKLDFSFVGDNHFNFITVASVLAGLLFTSLSMMMGFLNNEIMRIFERADLLKDVYSRMILSINLDIFFIIFSLINIVLFEQVISDKVIMNLVYAIELAIIVYSLYVTLLVVNDIKVIVNSIHIDNKNKVETEDANQVLDNIITKYKDR